MKISSNWWFQKMLPTDLTLAQTFKVCSKPSAHSKKYLKNRFGEISVLVTFHPSLKHNMLTWTSLTMTYDQTTNNNKQHPRNIEPLRFLLDWLELGNLEIGNSPSKTCDWDKPFLKNVQTSTWEEHWNIWIRTWEGSSENSLIWAWPPELAHCAPPRLQQN